MSEKNALESFEHLRRSLPESEQANFDHAVALKLVEYGNIASDVGSLAMRKVEDESIEPSWDDRSILTTLSPEKQLEVANLKMALADRFSTKRRRLYADDFGLVTPNQPHGPRTVLLLTAANGLYRGSFDRVMSQRSANKARYSLSVDGETYDTRQGITWEVYQAFINQAKANGSKPLPDSIGLIHLKGKTNTFTWLSDPSPNPSEAYCGVVANSKAKLMRYSSVNGWSNIRFRPAIIIE